MELKEFCSLGGKARAAKLSKERQVEIASNAAKSRWSKKVEKPILVAKPEKVLNEERGKCQVNGCSNLGKGAMLHGFKAWLCDIHSE